MHRPLSSVYSLSRRRVASALLLGLFLLAEGPCLRAQPADAPPSSDSLAQSGPWVPPPIELWRDAVDIARGPFTMSASERWWALGSTAVLIGAAATIDVPAYDHLSPRSANGGSDAARSVTAPLARPGEWYDRRNSRRFALGVAGGIAVSGLVLRNRVLTRTSVRTLEAFVYTELVNGFLKSALNRARPYVGAEPEPFAFDLGGFKGEHAELAMPSGHAAQVFALASVWAEAADRWYVTVPLYAGAASVGVERVRSGDHWLTDVLVGAALGTLIGRSVADGLPAEGASNADAASPGVQYRPVVSTRRVGVQVRF
jgi:hypothetical protein